MSIASLAPVEEFLRAAVTQPSSPAGRLAAPYLDGGKRLRARLALLVAACGPHDPDPAYRLAASLELIHLASLIHDDILDDSRMRRSRPALHLAVGQVPAVLAGDYLFAAAFALLAEVPPEVLRVVTEAIGQLCDGEIMEICGREDGEAGYYERVEKKTAALLVAAAEGGGHLCRLPTGTRAHLAAFGRHLGIAFQIVDDVLDLIGDPGTLGKPRWQDIVQGVLTLPVLYFLRVAPPGPAWKARLAAGGLTEEDVAALLPLLEEYGCVAYAVQAAEQQLSLATRNLEVLPAGPAREELRQLTLEVITPLTSLRPLH